MKRTIMTILVTTLGILTWFSPPLANAASAFAADKAAPEASTRDQKPQPEIAIPDPQFTFANVVDGIEVVHDFTVYNRGAGDLAIAKVQTG